MTRITTHYAASHISPKGPGDDRPTALQIIQDQKLVGAHPNKTFLITGANESIGIETARALHLTGARIIITARSEEKCSKAIRSIVESNGGEKGGIDGITMDLGGLDDVRRAAAEFLEKNNRLNVLVCNAGVYSASFAHTKQGFEQMFGVNHLGHFLLFNLLAPLMLKSSSSTFNSRLVMVASVSHRTSEVSFEDPNFTARPFNDALAYGQSKTANIYMAKHVDRLFGAQGLHAWSLQPGGIASQLWNCMVPGMVDTATLATSPSYAFNKTTAQGAATQVWAAVGGDLEGKGGKYLESMQEIWRWDGAEHTRGDWTVPGHADFIHDDDKAEKLWSLSEELVGTRSLGL